MVENFSAINLVVSLVVLTAIVTGIVFWVKSIRKRRRERHASS